MKKTVGAFSPETPFFLAPMAGFSDMTFRRICGEMGASLTYTEMVSAKGLYYGDRKSSLLLETSEDEKPVAFQIFGSDPDIMAWAAEKLSDRENVILDINMGCPVPKVVRNGEGSALLRDPDLVYRIVRSAAGATDKPVTVKMRTGIEGAPEGAALLCAQAAQEGGAGALAVHGRTREQYYSGEADLDAIKSIKSALDIPVIGNGDIRSWEDAKHMMDYTGCDFVMVARGAMGNPWIFRELIAGWNGEPIPDRPTREEIKSMIIYHYKGVESAKGEYSAVREMRKNISRYLKGMEGSLKVRRSINSIESGEELCRVIEEEL